VSRLEQKFERNTRGLRDALMCEMEDMRAGIASPDEAFAFAKLAEKVIESLQADLTARIYEDKIEEAKRLERMEERKLLAAPENETQDD
jgi:hypothetical protein